MLKVALEILVQTFFFCSVVPDSPAEVAGLKSGDNLISVNNRNVTR